MLKPITLAATLAMALPAAALDVERREALGTVDVVLHDLENAIATIGFNIFAIVPHSKGAESVGMELNDAALIIFGSPTGGTPLMQQDIHGGLVLPLKMLVYADDGGQTWVAWQDVDDMFDGLGIDMESEQIANIRMTMENLAAEAAD